MVCILLPWQQWLCHLLAAWCVSCFHGNNGCAICLLSAADNEGIECDCTSCNLDKLFSSLKRPKSLGVLLSLHFMMMKLV